ncbi:hypothetical protein J6590_090023 [Homalodisca vitripennis]|nr:hypothetical protein J6590_090023 [Homalodisca vitripennis]
MLQYLEKHNQLSDEQVNRQQDAVESFVDLVFEGLENLNTTLGAFLDLSKTFDCVDHKTLIEKLKSHGMRALPHAGGQANTEVLAQGQRGQRGSPTACRQKLSIICLMDRNNDWRRRMQRNRSNRQPEFSVLRGACRLSRM